MLSCQPKSAGLDNFTILYEDEDILAIDKPCHILVHPTKITEDKVFVLPLLERQLGLRLLPIHRLDRPTSGVLLFAKNNRAAAHLSQQFREQSIQKTYHAIVRGYTEQEGLIDYAIGDHDDKTKPKREAITVYHCLAQSEVPLPIGRYPTARFSYVEARPKTGRRHQIRRHFAHLRHPIIGDKRHGDIKHNRYFWEDWNIKRMLLHASQLDLVHPVFEHKMTIQAPLDAAFQNALKLTDLIVDE